MPNQEDGRWRSTCKRPGGAMPQSWELFAPAANSVLFVRQCGPASFEVASLLPGKTPLDPHFDENLRKMRAKPPVLDEPCGDDSLASRQIREKERTSRARYFDQWHPQDVQDHVSQHGNSLNGLQGVFNLCTTERYYRADDLGEVPYAFFRLRGGPNNSLLPEVQGFVNSFLNWFDNHCTSVDAASLEDVPKKLSQNPALYRVPFLFVHCTHGVNRTGFMLCSLMILLAGFSREQALQTFFSVRGHPMNRVELMDELQQLSPPEHPDFHCFQFKALS